jgi:hypothetical protein
VAEAVASASASKDDLYKQLSDEVAKSGMDADRKEHAFKVIGIACKRLTGRIFWKACVRPHLARHAEAILTAPTTSCT